MESCLADSSSVAWHLLLLLFGELLPLLVDVGVAKSKLLSQHGDLLRSNECALQLAHCSARVLVRLFQLLPVNLPEVFEFQPLHFQDLKCWKAASNAWLCLLYYALLLPALAESAPRRPASPVQGNKGTGLILPVPNSDT